MHQRSERGGASESEPPPPNASPNEAPVTPAIEVSGDSSSEEVAIESTVSAKYFFVLRQGVRLMTVEELIAYRRSKACWDLTSESSPEDYTSDDSEGHSTTAENIRPHEEIIDLSSDSEI